MTNTQKQLRRMLDGIHREQALRHYILDALAAMYLNQAIGKETQGGEGIVKPTWKHGIATCRNMAGKGWLKPRPDGSYVITEGGREAIGKHNAVLELYAAPEVSNV